MTDLRQAAQAVLERWDSPLWKTGTTAAAIADLRTALEQPEQEPVGEVLNERGEIDYISYVPPVGTRLYTTPTAQPEQQAEPVAWLYKTVDAGLFVSDQQPSDVEVWNDIEWSKPLYPTPPQRPWQGLTVDEIRTIAFDTRYVGLVGTTRAIEAKLKERNT